MIKTVYFVIILLATTIGAITGMGGGVIIKPLLDLINVHSADTINFYSCCAVLIMSIVSLIKQIKRKTTFQFDLIIILALSSIVGGFVGDSLFSYLKTFTNIKKIQNIILCLSLCFILIYTLRINKIKRLKIKNKFIIFCLGLVLGITAVFLGIGGGPLNILFLSYFFSFSPKECSLLSIDIIFFSQITKFIKTLVEGKIINYDLSIVPFIIVSAVLGGLIGSTINAKFDNKQINKLYLLAISSLIIITIINFI